MAEKLLKETLKKLYVKEKKTTCEIAKIYGCSEVLVRYRLRKCRMKQKNQAGRIALKKVLLQKLYVKDGKSTREIAKSLGCSPETVRLRCKEYRIKLRLTGGWSRTIAFDKAVLQRLYVKEGKSLVDVAELLSCSPRTVQKRCKEHGIMIREAKRIKRADKKILQNYYLNKSTDRKT